MDASSLSPDISEWIASVILSAAIPATYYLLSLNKLGARLDMLEYRIGQLERKYRMRGNDNSNNSDNNNDANVHDRRAGKR